MGAAEALGQYDILGSLGTLQGFHPLPHEPVPPCPFPFPCPPPDPSPFPSPCPAPSPPFCPPGQVC